MLLPKLAQTLNISIDKLLGYSAANIELQYAIIPLQPIQFFISGLFIQPFK